MWGGPRSFSLPASGKVIFEILPVRLPGDVNWGLIKGLGREKSPETL